MDDSIWVQFPVPDIYFGMLSATQANSAFHPSGVSKWEPASAGKEKADECGLYR